MEMQKACTLLDMKLCYKNNKNILLISYLFVKNLPEIRKLLGLIFLIEILKKKMTKVIYLARKCKWHKKGWKKKSSVGWILDQDLVCSEIWATKLHTIKKHNYGAMLQKTSMNFFRQNIYWFYKLSRTRRTIQT